MKYRIGLFSFCCLVFAFACSSVTAEEKDLSFVPKMTPKLEKGMKYAKDRGITIYDMHIHLRGGMTAEKAAIREELTGIKSGVLENHGQDWPLSDDVKLRAFIEDSRKYPVFVGIQVNDRDWYERIDPKLLEELDFVLADTMIMGLNKEEKPQKLWFDDYKIDDPEKWMETYMEHNLCILDEPITILANPTYLPDQIAKQYDKLWTDERMERIIKKAVEKNIALEIQAESPFPKKRFLELAKKHGAMISLGTNNHNDRPHNMDRWFELIEELDLKPVDWKAFFENEKSSKK